MNFEMEKPNETNGRERQRERRIEFQLVAVAWASATATACACGAVTRGRNIVISHKSPNLSVPNCPKTNRTFQNILKISILNLIL